MKVKVPASAAGVPPVIGVSKKLNPCSIAVKLNSLAATGDIVLVSQIIAPFFARWNTPSFGSVRAF
jgi:hypothetical protein